MIQYYYQEEIKALNKNKIKYLIVGGLAVNLYGLHRLTSDLDLMIDLSEEGFDRFIGVVEKMGYFTKAPKSEWGKLAAIAFRRKKDEDKKIDVFLKNPIDFVQAYRRRKVFRAGDFQISCVGLEDLIKLKTVADRLRDWIDIGSLKRMEEIKKNK